MPQPQGWRPRVSQAILPAAGLATRLAPVSLVVPKEMLPVGALPAIHWVLEGAAAAGVREAAIVCSPSKAALRWYLESADHPSIQALRERLSLRFVQQTSPTGINEALLLGWQALHKPAVVAVLMPDCVRVGGAPPLDELLSTYAAARALPLGRERLPWPPVSIGALQAFSSRRGDGARSSYRTTRWRGPVLRVRSIEHDTKGAVGTGTSIMGATFFERLEFLASRKGKFDDGDALRILLTEEEPLFAVRLSSPPVFDLGNPLGLASAQASWCRKGISAVPDSV